MRKWPIEDNPGTTIRSLAIRIIRNVEEGLFLDESINRAFSENTLPDNRKSLIYEITSGVIRWRGYLEWIISRLVKKNIKNDVRYLLWTSLYQISFMKKADYHVVNETVEFAKKEFGVHIAGFVNAVLRRFIREKSAFTCTQDTKFNINDLSVSRSFPQWLIRRWTNRFGRKNSTELLDFFNRTPEFTLRVDTKKINKDKAAEELKNIGISARYGKYSEYSIYIDKLTPIFKTELFKNGLIHIQDEASQLVEPSINPKNGDMILDACAGMGTKTTHIRERSKDIHMIAMDNEIKRLKHIGENTNRILGDALHPPFNKESFDIILLDAPCSSLGIIRKHPEIKWRRNEKDISDFGNYQLNLLDSLWDNLKPGGHLVYSVCSFEPEETFDVIEMFSKRRPFVLEKPLPLLFNSEYFLSVPFETGMDGFFIAKLKKI